MNSLKEFPKIIILKENKILKDLQKYVLYSKLIKNPALYYKYK